MVQTVFIEPAWKLPPTYSYMIDFPPDGYKFAVTQHAEEKVSQTLARSALFYNLERAASEAVPTVLIKSWLQRFRKPPPGTALTYAHGHLVFRPEPWVVEIEYASLLLGSSPRMLDRFRRVIERSLASPFCRGVRLWSEAVGKALMSQLDCQGFRDKMKVVYTAVPPKEFVKEYGGNAIRLLVLGSASTKGRWDARRIEVAQVVEAFKHLRQRYPNLELVIREDLPAALKVGYAGMENLRIIDRVIPQAALDREFQSADIYIYLPRAASSFRILEAMSYELPIIGASVWFNAEYIVEGKTGLLVNPSQSLLFASDRDTRLDSPEFYKPTERIDQELVKQMVQKLSLLIENAELRKKLGQAGRREVETGKFSIAARNTGLKKLFDEAIAGVNADKERRGA